MDLTDQQKKIYKGQLCPYCLCEPDFVDSALVYGQSYGMLYYCYNCGAYVGVHKKGRRALGRLANAELREWKKRAHAAFDPIWQQDILSRNKAYAWLSKQLDLPREYTHIGMFSVETCKRVVALIDKLLNELKQYSMKVKSLELKNFANYDHVKVSFDENVTYLIGKNGAGKSTLGLSGIHFMFQGIAEKSSAGSQPLIGERFRFIGPSAKTASGEMILHDEKLNVDIKVKRKLKKEGTELSFEAPDKYDLSQKWLNELFNLFLIAPKKFIELPGKDQAKAIGIDISKFDAELVVLKQEYTMIGREIKMMGDIDEVEKAEKVDIKDLLAQKEVAQGKWDKKYQENKTANETKRNAWLKECTELRDDITKFNLEQEKRKKKIDRCNELLMDLKGEGYEGKEVDSFIAGLPVAGKNRLVGEELPKEPEYIPELPDKTELHHIEKEINEAAATNVKAGLYDDYKVKLQRKLDKEKELEDNKEKQSKKVDERTAYIQSFEMPFDGLEINEDGDLLLNKKLLCEPYFSTGELLKIVPQLLSVQNPEMKYVYIQDGSLLDGDNLKELEDHLVAKGFQLVIECVGIPDITQKNVIKLKDNRIEE